MTRFLLSLALVVTCVGSPVVAADRAEYNRRSAERFMAMFRASDVDADKVVSRHDARTTIELTAKFDDIDIDRNGYITWAELTRYIDGNFR